MARLLLLVVLLGLVRWAAATTAASAVIASAGLQEHARHTLNLTHAEVQHVLLHKPSLVSVLLDGELHQMELEPCSVRAEGFQLLVQNEDGELVEHEAGPEHTVCGRLYGHNGSAVAGSLHEDGLHAYIDKGGIEYFIEPVPRRGRSTLDVPASTHAVYKRSALGTSHASCAEPRHMDHAMTLAVETPLRAQALGVGCNYVAELAIDTDYPYFQRYGSASGVNSRIATIVNIVNKQYLSQVQIRHKLTTVIVRSSNRADPYSANDVNNLLTQMTNEWNNNRQSVKRDLAQLFTGRQMSSNVIGNAYVGTTCVTSYAYSVAQSDWSPSLGDVTDTTAHELGHSWSSMHINSIAYTMYPSIQGVNVFRSSDTVPLIKNFAAGRSCLTTECGSRKTCRRVSITCNTGSSDDGYIAALPSRLASGTVYRHGRGPGGLRVGDSGASQFKFFVSCSTRSIPRKAYLRSVTLVLRRGSSVNPTPMRNGKFGSLYLDMSRAFTGSKSLTPADFVQKRGENINVARSSLQRYYLNYYLRSSKLSAFPKAGIVQFRGYFGKRTNGDKTPNWYGFYSSRDATRKPRLAVYYCLG
eukprot:jgi/Chlat1/3256/Chrsp22S03516